METIEAIKQRVRDECQRLQVERDREHYKTIHCECGDSFVKGDNTIEARKKMHEDHCEKHKDYVRLMKVEIDKLLLPKE